MASTNFRSVHQCPHEETPGTRTARSTGSGQTSGFTIRKLKMSQVFEDQTVTSVICGDVEIAMPVPSECSTEALPPEVPDAEPGLGDAFAPAEPPEVGKGGKAAPPLPPLQRASARNVAICAPPASEVFTPAPDENLVLVALRREGLYQEQIASAQHRITCPWSDDHEPGGKGIATYTEPSDVFPLGGFACGHRHGQPLYVEALLDYLEIDATVAKGKPVIRHVDGEIVRLSAAAEYVLARSGTHFHSGGRIVALKNDAGSGDLAVEAITDQALVKALSKVASWQKYDGRSKRWLRCDPRPQLINSLMKGQGYEVLQPLSGLARQPYFRTGGTLVMAPGYDPESQTYADFDPAEFPLPEPTEEAAREALEALKGLLDEFHFAGPGDLSAALCAILTATVRAALPVAPAFNISASGSGSGKSYLAATIAPFAGPGQPESLPYPESRDDASKKMIALLINKPAVAIFDDMQTDWLPYTTMNRMLTSETMADRILSRSQMVTVSTRCFFMGTGNNVQPARDMCRRVVTIYLSPRTSSPATLRYKGRPAEEVRRNRGKFVAAALTIVRAWQAAGKPRGDEPYIATYGDEWADMCRYPLTWLGEIDPARSLIEQVESDPDGEAFAILLQEWARCFGPRPMMVREVIQRADNGVMEALRDLPIIERNGEINRDRFGWLLKKNANRIMQGMELKRTPTSQRTAWTVTPVDAAGQPASPPLRSAVRKIVDSDGPVRAGSLPNFNPLANHPDDIF